MDNLTAHPNHYNNYPRPRHYFSTHPLSFRFAPDTTKPLLPANDLRLHNDPFLLLILRRGDNTRDISRRGSARRRHRGVGLVGQEAEEGVWGFEEGRGGRAFLSII